MEKEERLKEIGGIALRVLDDGREISVIRTLFNWRLCVGPEGAMTIDDFFCYHELGEALLALGEWSGEGDPPGRWHRHLLTSRRREHGADGEVVREWIQP